MKYLSFTVLLLPLMGCYTVVRTASTKTDAAMLQVEIERSDPWSYYEGEESWWDATDEVGEEMLRESHNYGRQRTGQNSTSAPWMPAFPIVQSYETTVVSTTVVESDVSLDLSVYEQRTAPNATPEATSSVKASAKQGNVQTRNFGQRTTSVVSKTRKR